MLLGLQLRRALIVVAAVIELHLGHLFLKLFLGPQNPRRPNVLKQPRVSPLI